MSPAAAVLSITEERTYSAKLGDRIIAGLAVASRWEGLTKYTDRYGQHLVVLDVDQRVITASPDLIAQLGLSALSAQPESDFTGAIGAPYGGGYFTGIITVDGKRYALITAGAEGELRGIWNRDYSGPAAPVSRCDGASNTLTMVAAGSALAAQAMDLTIGGHKDWYIPSRDELELMYRNLKPTTQRNAVTSGDGANSSSLPVGRLYTEDCPAQTIAANFRTGGVDALAAAWYWSSTQHASSPSYAWGQGFYVGVQGYDHKSYGGRVRVVRRLPI
ncbi:Lcl domain-containing protein [Rugamonas aquatica]|uniref:DUF1566 domain-containing protein n=1 Tax=Rugamonas aquatica TaxID=2743357 RepID=A0A6A7N1Z4_9BURK|nr:DUF1566 domain-containing protein [Rugamonas aquatica]MQA39007.1 DUF1566 domain-containing protein [Rugamonas aquatica]